MLSVFVQGPAVRLEGIYLHPNTSSLLREALTSVLQPRNLVHSPAALEDNTEYLYSIGGNYTGSKAPPISEVVCWHCLPGQVRNPELLE